MGLICGRMPAALALVVAALALTACGDEGTPSEPDARATAAEFLSLYAAYDPALCELSSSERQALIELGSERAEITGESCEDVIGQAKADLDEMGETGLLIEKDLLAAAEEIDEAEVSIGDGVALLYFPDSDSFTGSVSLVAEDGEWRVADLDVGGG